GDAARRVLARQVLVTRLARLVERVVETVLELVGQHFGRTFQVERSTAASGLLERAHERVLVIPRIRRDLRHLSFSDLVCEYPTDPLTPGVDLQHDARCRR